MMNEAVRIIDSALRNGTIGIGVKLAAITRESGDALPTTPTIYNEMEHEAASRDAFPDDAAHVILISSGLMDPANPRFRPVQDEGIEILLRGCLRNTNTPAALRTVSYVFLAVTQTLGALMTTSTGEGLRLRNGVGLHTVNGISGGITAAPLTDTPITWQMRFTCVVRAPNG